MRSNGEITFCLYHLSVSSNKGSNEDLDVSSGPKEINSEKEEVLPIKDEKEEDVPIKEEKEEVTAGTNI